MFPPLLYAFSIKRIAPVREVVNAAQRCKSFQRPVRFLRMKTVFGLFRRIGSV